MKCNFNKRQNISSLEVKVLCHIVSKVTQFKYLEFIAQNDGEIKGDVN